MIRFQRVGRRNEPTFRLVLTDSKNGPKSGRFLEVLGAYDSRRGEKAEINIDRVRDLMSKGAKLSGSVHNLLIEKKLMEGKKINVLPKKTVAKVEEPAPAPEVVAEAPSPVAETTPEPAPAEAPVA